MLVKLEGIGHRFPPAARLFSGLTTVLEAGDSTALLGPSGCGKSTLLRILAGATMASEGVVSREGVGRVGWVMQQPFGVAGRTAVDHVSLPLLAKGQRRAEAEVTAFQVLTRFGLAGVAKKRFAELSGGESQRLMLARAVVSPSDLLLVDEPTAQLDPVSAQAVCDVISGITTSDRIVVVATHDIMVANQCTRQIVLTAPSRQSSG